MSVPRLVVVSPFLDKLHGTERCVVEQVERLAAEYEAHVYSNFVADLDLSRIVWHRVPALPGPHLFAYCWWILANHFQRWRDARYRGLAPDLVYSPGINCFDADVISVHMLFSEYRLRMRTALELGTNPLHWPRLLHRRIYYRLLTALERWVYGSNRALLIVVSRNLAGTMKRYGKAPSQLPIITHGIDVRRFSPDRRLQLRPSARQAFGLSDSDFCLLLIGNHWKNKGLDALLGALGRLDSARVRLMAVGDDTVEPYSAALRRLRLQDQVTFLASRPDVEVYYAAADAYVGPSLQDAFALPALEAMACGIPAIVSSRAGVSELITDGVNGFVLDDPEDSARLADLIALLVSSESLRSKIADAAVQTARQYTWERNAEQLDQVFKQVLRKPNRGRALAAAHERAQ